MSWFERKLKKLFQSAISFEDEIKVDIINEYTSATGVTIDGVVCKDTTVQAHELIANTQVQTDSIIEKTSAAGVTIDGLLIKDSGIPEAAVTAHEAAIDHDNLTNFSADEHYTKSAITASDLSDVTDSTAFTPVWSCGGSMSLSSDPTVGFSAYQQIGNIAYFTMNAYSGTLDVSGGADTDVYFTFPPGLTSNSGIGSCWIRDGDGTYGHGQWYVTTSNRIRVRKEDVSNWTGGANFGVAIFGRAVTTA